MKLHDPAVERMVERLADGPAEIVYLSVEINDPDQGPFVDHLGLVIGRDVPRDSSTRPGRAAPRRSARRSAREPDAAQARAFEAYLGSLVHDVSLAHHLLRSLGIVAPLPLADAAYFDGGRGVSLDWVLPADGRAHLEHLNLPGVSDYRERMTAYCRDRILELTFPSPYLRHFPTRLVERRSDGSPAGLETIESGSRTRKRSATSCGRSTIGHDRRPGPGDRRRAPGTTWPPSSTRSSSRRPAPATA